MTGPVPEGRTERARGLAGDPTGSELRRRSARSGMIQLAAQPLTVALYVASGMVLARLLTPADFGVFAMAMTWIALVYSIHDFGLPLAALQGDTLDDELLSGLFWANLRLSVGIVAVSIAMAPAIAWFYDEPAVAPVTIAMAAGSLGASLGWQHRSVLERQLRFRPLVVLDVLTLAISIVLGVGTAVAGAGYWALALQFVALGVGRTIGVWILVRWRPLRRSALPAWRSQIAPFLRFGWQYSATRLLWYVGNNIDRVLIAAAGGARPAGLYDNAYRWANYPVVHVFPPLLKVAVSSLSRARSSVERYVAGVQGGLLPLLSIILPALGFVALEARPVILVLLGDQWSEAVPLFRLLALGAMARGLVMVTRWLYLSEGRTSRQLRWAVVDTAVLAAAMSVGIIGGAYGVALAFTVASWLLVLPSLAFCFAGSLMTLRDYAAVAWRPMVATAVALGALLAIRGYLGGRTELEALVLRVMGFGFAYLSIWLALPGRRSAIRRVTGLVRQMRG